MRTATASAAADDPDGPVPLLDLAMQAEQIPGPVYCWGSRPRSAPLPGGTWHCYSYDYRFRNLAKRPWKLPATAPYAAVEPNWSTWPEMDADEARRLTLLKRRIALAWQRSGVRIWVDLNVAPNHARVNLIGVPFGWRSYATRAHRDAGLTGLLADFGLACDRAGTDAIRFLVVGGSSRVREFCTSRGWLWAVEHSDRVRGRPGGRAAKGATRAHG